ncbi:zinc finger BED domain-containing protein 4 isoform X1 [Coregonus clupeaformis]|uniref:zinc finger BED domain-containing protein 4 isoform X1 n=2 Tax=Coregonus clupeaformis TaxID=59861 RepID=UPI001E1C7BC7|nr:zinc finger BED domain-containing protein 4 isoform X1 [Coregonus clupeaformis]
MEGYQPLKGSLYGSFGFKLDAKGILTDKSIVYCFHCEQSFSYHRSKTSLQYHLRKKHPLVTKAKPSDDGESDSEITVISDNSNMDFRGYPLSSSLGPNLRRRGDRGAAGLVLDRRKSTVWNYYIQLNEMYVECNICKRQLSFHNSTTTMREHLVRKHNIRDNGPPVLHNTVVSVAPIPATSLQPRFPCNISTTSTTANTCMFQTDLQIVVKEEQQDADLSPEQGTAKRARFTCAPPDVGGGANANPVCSQDLEPSNSNTGLLYSENNNFGDSNRSGTYIKESNDKRTGFLTDLILEVVYRDLQPLSVVEEKGFCLLLSCLEPQYPMPSPSQLGSLIWHRYDVLKRQLQQCLQSGLAPRGITLCTEYWRSVAGCEEGACGRLFFTVSAHFVDKDWRLARCVLQTRPMPDIRERAGGRGFTQFGDTLKAVLSEFHLPQSSVFCVVHDAPRTLEARGTANMGLQKEKENQIAGPGQSPQDLPEGWVVLKCAGEALKLCIQEGLWMEPVRQALAEARRIISHFQHDAPAAAALIHKAEAAYKAGACLVLDDPGRWATTVDMCESLLGLKWVVSSVLEEQKAAPNLADHQWRLLQELVPVLKTMRIAASFLSEDINVSISALMPCLHGVSRVLRQHIAESSCPVAQGVMETVQSGMERQWRLGEEEALLDSPAILSSFLDPRFKELRFLSPHARSKLHDKVKEQLSAQAQIEAEEISRECDKGGDDEEDEEGRGVTNMELNNSQSTIAHLQPPFYNQVSPGPKTMYDILLGEDPTERMPEIHQQLENYIAEPLCKRSLSPLHWWRSKEHRFPAVARLARTFLAIPTTAVAADRAFAPRETTVAQRRAILGPQCLDHILFLHQNSDYVEKLMGVSTGHGERGSDRNGAKKTRETLYQSLVSYESKTWVGGEKL